MRLLLPVSCPPHSKEKRGLGSPHAVTHAVPQFLFVGTTLEVRPLGKAANLIYGVIKDFHLPTELVDAAGRDGWGTLVLEFGILKQGGKFHFSSHLLTMSLKPGTVTSCELWSLRSCLAMPPSMPTPRSG